MGLLSWGVASDLVRPAVCLLHSRRHPHP